MSPAVELESNGTANTATTTTPVSDSNNNTTDAKDPFNVMELWKDLKPDDLIRGQTPPDVAKRCLQLARDYVGGVWALWAKDPEKDVTVTRITGGLTNQLYKVTLSEEIQAKIQDSHDEPSSVAIKLYMKKHNIYPDEMPEVLEAPPPPATGQEDKVDFGVERLSDTIILTVTSHLGLGPKVYGIFPDGAVFKYYEHEQFRPKHQQNPVLLRRVATMMAQFHSLDVPLKKVKRTSNPQVTMLRLLLAQASAMIDVPAVAEEYNFQPLKDHPLDAEVAWLTKLMAELETPMVLCHNDFRGSNILVTGKEGEETIYLCDAEYCRYGARAFDMATFMTEWGKELFDFSNWEIPNDPDLITFVEYYRDAMERIRPGFGKLPENGTDQMVKQLKIYIVVNFLVFTMFSMMQKESLIESIPFNFQQQMGVANACYSFYHALKSKLVEQGVIKV